MSVSPFTKKKFFAYLLGLSIIVFTMVLWWFSLTLLRRYEQARFQTERNRVVHEISSRLQTYIDTLMQARIIFHLSEKMNHNDFATYVKELNIRKKYPGIQGVGFTQRLSFKEIPKLEKMKQKEGAFNFKVWPTYPREEVFSIIHLEPLDWRNQRALGFDMYTDPVRKKAMDLAWEKNDVAMSGPVELVQETQEDTQLGFLIYAPVYKKDAPIFTLQDRKKYLTGMVYAPFRSQDLFNQIMHPLKELKIEVHVAVDDLDQRTLLYHSHPHMLAHQDHLSWSGEMEFAQMKWIITISALEDFYQSTAFYLPLLILILGVLLGLVVMIYLLENITRNAELAQAVAVRDEFVNIASHELKTPVTAIKLQMEMTLRMIEKGNQSVYAPAEVEKRVRRTLRQLDRMTKLIGDMLDATRFSLQGMSMNRRFFDLKILLEEFIERQKEQLIVEKIDLQTNIQNTPAWVFADEYRIEQILNNLFTNAIKYGQKKTISIELKLEAQEVLLSVTDQGIGIPPEGLETIFQRYGRASSASNISGLGLGLYISQQIALAHGGIITVKSELGVGSTFTLHLPLKEKKD
jgi:two-component system, OmpR family, sensor kinase